MFVYNCMTQSTVSKGHIFSNHISNTVIEFYVDVARIDINTLNRFLLHVHILLRLT